MCMFNCVHVHVSICEHVYACVHVCSCVCPSCEQIQADQATRCPQASSQHLHALSRVPVGRPGLQTTAHRPAFLCPTPTWCPNWGALTLGCLTGLNGVREEGLSQPQVGSSRTAAPRTTHSSPQRTHAQGLPGDPWGLTGTLCRSDAFLEGYVQQFLYTFRYFCSPHDFLHFLLERVSSTLAG